MPNDVVGTVIVEHAEIDPDDGIEHDAGLDGALDVVVRFGEHLASVMASFKACISSCFFSLHCDVSRSCIARDAGRINDKNALDESVGANE